MSEAKKLGFSPGILDVIEQAHRIESSSGKK